MITTLLVATLFACAVCLIVYFSINEKMHAQPWRLMALGMIALIFGFCFQTSIDYLAAMLNKMRPNEQHLEDIKLILLFVNIVVAAFSGGLISTAVANRALHLNSKRLKELKERENRCQEIYLRANEIKSELSNKSISISRADFRKKYQYMSKLLAEYVEITDEIQDEREQLTL